MPSPQIHVLSGSGSRNLGSQLRDAAGDRVLEPEIKGYPWWFRALCVALCIAGSIWAAGLLGCSPPRLPPPDARGTLEQLDRIEGRILTHELTTARWRCHGTR